MTAAHEALAASFLAHFGHPLPPDRDTDDPSRDVDGTDAAEDRKWASERDMDMACGMAENELMRRQEAFTA